MSVLSVFEIYLVLAVIARAYLFSYIANRNNYDLGGPGGFSFRTLLFYTKPVLQEFESLKRLCNVIYIHNVVVLILVIILNLLDT
jgi:ABC-type branched-subunit amino acid transport system permease subunit